MKEVGYGSAPGKIILTGEHSVVYGYPALAIAINLRCEVTTRTDNVFTIHSQNLNNTFTYDAQQIASVVNGQTVHQEVDNIAFACFSTLKRLQQNYLIKLNINSEIPISAGLGSSAAVVVASIASILDLHDSTFSKEEISQIGFEAEKITHGKPSGIDNSIATYGGLINFQNGKIIHQQLNHSIPFIVGNSNVPRDTKILVQEVANLKNLYSEIVDPILEIMGKVAIEVEEALVQNNISKLGELFNLNQGLLDTIGVGHEMLSKMIWRARELGAIGAKLTGAGGGGCIVALTKDNQSAVEVSEQMTKEGFTVFQTSLSTQGVIIGRDQSE